MNLIRITTNMRAVCIWTQGHERTALASFIRKSGEVVYSVRRL